MAKIFDLKILTPEHEFFSGNVEGISAQSPDGNIMILADHAPMIMPVSIGILSVKIDGKWEEYVCSEGFLEAHSEGVLIFVQSCEHPDEIDTKRAQEAERRAREHLRQKQSISEHKQSQIALARAMTRLQAQSKYRH